MNNKGFTLVELLAVLVILSLLITVAVPSVNKTLLNINENMYCEKVTNLENAARLYAEDYYMDQSSIDEKVIEGSIPLSILIEKSSIHTCYKITYKFKIFIYLVSFFVFL